MANQSGPEKIPFPPPNYSASVQTKKLRKESNNCPKCLVSLLISAFAIFCALLFLVGGIYTFFNYHSPASESTTVLGHRNDTILLKGGIDSFKYSNVTVNQCISRGDDYHNAYIYVIKSKDVMLKSLRSFVRFNTHHQLTASYKSGIQDYLYLLESSNFTYRICLASMTDRNQSATYFLFDSAANYWSYENQPEDGEEYSLFSQTLTAGRNNESICTEISYPITRASYYFMMVRSPANISYAYNFTLHKAAYDTTSTKQYCKVSDFNNCEIPLASDDFEHIRYDILAFVQPSEVANSIVTHFCVSIIAGSTTLTKLSHIAVSLMGMGGALLLIVVSSLLFYALVMHFCRKRKFDEERQTLLYHY